jgi:hypothetical protein
MPQAVECLPSKHEAQSSNSSPTKNQTKRKNTISGLLRPRQMKTSLGGVRNALGLGCSNVFPGVCLSGPISLYPLSGGSQLLYNDYIQQ